MHSNITNQVKHVGEHTVKVAQSCSGLGSAARRNPRRLVGEVGDSKGGSQSMCFARECPKKMHVYAVSYTMDLQLCRILCHRPSISMHFHAVSYAMDLQYLCTFMLYPMPWTFNIYAFVQGIFYYMDFLIYGVFFYMALLGSGPRAFGAQDVCIFTRDPEPSGLRIYAFLHRTLSLEGSGCTHFCTGP